MKLPKRTIILLSGYRTGSNLVAQVFQRNGFGDPKEYFQIEKRREISRFNKKQQVDQIVKIVSENTCDNLFSVKLPIGDFCDIMQRLELDPLRLPKMHEIFGEIAMVRISREDRFAQAVSMWRARETGEWVRREGSEKAFTPEFDFRGIKDAYDWLASLEPLAYEVYRRNREIERHMLIYEQFIRDPDNILEVLRNLFAGMYADREMSIDTDHLMTRDGIATQSRRRFIRHWVSQLKVNVK